MILASELPGAKIIFSYEFLENIRMLERSHSDFIETWDIEERTLGLDSGHGG